MGKQVNEVVIRVSGEAGDLDPTINKLEKLGKVDSDNAKRFAENSKKHQDHLKKTSALIGDQSTEIGRLENRFQSLGERVVAAFAVERILHFGEECVTAFAEAEKSALKLNAALSAQGGTQKQFKELIEQSDKLGRSSIFSKTSVQNAQALAIQFGINGDVLREKVIPAVTDYASATGKDLNEALSDVLRGVEGNARALKLYGIEVKATGDKGYDLDNILGQLNEKFKGQSEVVASSTSGVIDRLANAWEDVKEAVGGTIVNMLTFPQAIQEVKAELDQGINSSSTKLRQTLAQLQEDYKKAVQEGSNTVYSLSLQITQIQSELREREVKAQKERNEVIMNLKKEFAHMSMEQLQYEATGENIIRAKYAQEEINNRKKAAEEKKKIEKEHWEYILKGLDQAIRDAEELYKKDTKNFIEEWKKKNEEASKQYEKAGEIALKADNELADDKVKLSKTTELKKQKELEKVKADQDYRQRVTEINNLKVDQKLKEDLLKAAEEHLNNVRAEIDQRYAKKEIEDLKKQVETIVDAIGKSFDTLYEQRSALIDKQEELEKSFIDTQTKLAVAGKNNTLGIEEKKLDELEKKRAQDAKKLKREKELQAFLEAVISYNKEDPKTALIKAFAQIAAIEGATALFAEEGGLIGDQPRTRLGRMGWSKRHRSGKDRLVLAEEGEAMFSRKNVANMGGPAAFMELKAKLDQGPLGIEKKIPIEMTMHGGNTTEMVQELREVKQMLKDQPHYHIDWESKADMDTLNVTRIEKGFKEVTKHQIKRPRIG